MADTTQPPQGEQAIAVARIGKPHGVRGEVTVQLHTDDPDERLRIGAALQTSPPRIGPLTITSVRVHQGRYLLGFDGVHDRTGAEALRNVTLVISRSRTPASVTQAAADETDGRRDVGQERGFYEDELRGLRVELVGGDPVGTVTALHTRPAQDLLEVERPAGSVVLIPFVEALVPLVDTEHARIVIDPPPGLLELDD